MQLYLFEQAQAGKHVAVNPARVTKLEPVGDGALTAIYTGDAEPVVVHGTLQEIVDDLRTAKVG